MTKDTPTPRTDDFPHIGCIGHDCDACVTRAQEFAQLTADLSECRAALDEWRERCFAMTATADRIGGLQRQAAAGEGKAREEVNELSIELAECRAALRELVESFDMHRNAFLQVHAEPKIHAMERMAAAWSAARAILQSDEGETK